MLLGAPGADYIVIWESGLEEGDTPESLMGIRSEILSEDCRDDTIRLLKKSR